MVRRVRRVSLVTSIEEELELCFLCFWFWLSHRSLHYLLNYFPLFSFKLVLILFVLDFLTLLRFLLSGFESLNQEKCYAKKKCVTERRRFYYCELNK